MIGKRLGRYEIIDKLGEGGMGAVWRARDTLLERNVALKTIPADRAESHEVRARFLREATAASHLHHGGIATVYDAGDSDGLLYITFQLIEGKSLKERLEEGPVTLEQALRIVQDAAEALQYAHERGVLHRDITSRNLMLDDSGRVLVVDFGLALDLDRTRLTMRPSPMGTAGYMAPETIRGEDADTRTDVYGLGSVFYELLTGRPPFRGNRLEQIVHSTLHESPQQPSSIRAGVPQAADDLVLAMLAKDREHRPEDCVEVARVIRGLRSELDSSVATTPLPVASHSPHWAGVRAWWRQPRVLAVVALLAILAVAGYVLNRLDRDTSLSSPEIRSAAVLPLRDLTPSSDEDTGWLAEALSSGLVDRMTRYEGLRMTPWVSSLRYDPLERDLGLIAQDLGVELLVTGNLRVIADELIVSLSLVESSGESQLWSEEFVGTVSALFELQTQMAERLATHLSPGQSPRVLGAKGTPPARDLEAYRLYNQGALRLREGTREGADAAYRHFERALEIDPDFADAHVGLGAVHSERYYLAREGGLRNLEIAREHFRAGLVADSTHSGALQGLVTLDYFRGDLVRLLERVQAARWSHGEDPEDLLLRGRAYMLGGMSDRAVGPLERLIELDPAHRAGRWFLTIALAWMGDYQGCIDLSESYIRRFGEDPEIRIWRGVAYSALQNHRRAVPEARLALRGWGDENRSYASLWAGLIYQRAGRLEEARQIWKDGANWGERRLAEYPDNLRLANIVRGIRLLLDPDAMEGTPAGAEDSQLQGDLESARSMDDEFVAMALRSPRESPEQIVASLREIDSTWGMPVRHRELAKLFASEEFLESEVYARYLSDARQENLTLRRRIRF